MPQARARAPKRNVSFPLALALFALAALLFVYAVLAASTSNSITNVTVESGAYADEASAALIGAQALKGEALVEEFNCIACHVLGDNRIAPRFQGLADRAGARRPALSAEQYLFESIVDPGAFLVEGYKNAMPANYARRLAREEIGHIIAYLMTLGGGAVEPEPTN